MNMVSQIAFDNMKYHKSKNILTGIAIFLTTVLLFVIPTVGKDLIAAQYAMVNEYYPQWHAVYRDVNQNTVNALSVHHDIGTFGLRSDVGFLVVEDEDYGDIDVAMMYLDENGARLYKQEISSGRYPQKENEIVISRSALEIMNLESKIGDTVLLPYQILRAEGLDYRQEKEFLITGVIEDEISGEAFLEDGFGEDICGLPEEYATEIEDGIIEGKATYEDLKSGEKVVIDKSLLHWYPELDVGEKLVVTVHDGVQAYEKELEIVAIGDYRGSMINYNYMIMAKEAADRLVAHNINRYFCVMAEQDYDETLYESLANLCDAKGRLNLISRKTIYEQNQTIMMLMNAGCYIFLGVLSTICIMNLVNTMINSVHVRRKELGMMQAIGMSDRQLQKMLLTEGMFYTVGTLIITLGLGSLLGYVAFVWAKEEEILRIRTFSYPWEIAGIIVVVLVIVQLFLAVMLSRSVKKESIIERIRFHE